MVGVVEDGGSRHTGEWMARTIASQMQHLVTDMGVKIVAVVTDGASNMENMRKRLVEGSGGDQPRPDPHF